MQNFGFEHAWCLPSLKCVLQRQHFPGSSRQVCWSWLKLNSAGYWLHISSTGTHMTRRHFQWWTRVIMGTLTGLHLRSPILCTSETFLSWPAMSYSAIWATVALLWNWTRWTNLHTCEHQWSLGTHDSDAGSPVVLPWTTFVGINHCVLRTPHKTCHFGDALTQSSHHHYVALVKVTHVLLLANFSCF